MLALAATTLSGCFEQIREDMITPQPLAKYVDILSRDLGMAQKASIPVPVSAAVAARNLAAFGRTCLNGVDVRSQGIVASQLAFVIEEHRFEQMMVKDQGTDWLILLSPVHHSMRESGYHGYVGMKGHDVTTYVQVVPEGGTARLNMATLPRRSNAMQVFAERARRQQAGCPDLGEMFKIGT